MLAGIGLQDEHPHLRGDFGCVNIVLCSERGLSWFVAAQKFANQRMLRKPADAGPHVFIEVI